MKSLRLKNHWSQEQLAQFSGLNVRTIQRVEKGDSVGLESLKSIAAVFKLSTDELLQAIESDKQVSRPCTDYTDGASDKELLKTKALEKAKSIKYFYIFSAFLIVTFMLFMLPNYNGGENLGPLVVSFLSFAAMIALYAYIVFEPFGEKWEQDKAAKILKEENTADRSSSEN
jgi:transcriptional regulator with XRE-family HTH domain